jgi:hypothetical protein
MPEHFRHDTRSCKVEVVSLLPHGGDEAIVHECRRKYEWGLGRIERQVLSDILSYDPYQLPTKGNPRFRAE